MPMTCFGPSAVVPDPSAYEPWLDVGHFDRAELEALLRPYPPETMEAYPVSTRLNTPVNNGEERVRSLATTRWK